MNTHAEQVQDTSKKATETSSPGIQSSGPSALQFIDNRPESIAQRKLQEMADNSLQAQQSNQFQQMADASPQATQLKGLQNLADHYSGQTVQKKENKTGLPDNLKSGIENLSGLSMDDVTVHYNSDKPSQMQAHAYAQGTDIYLGPNQEKHLPHEAWHVAQQKQGRVKPTVQMKGKVNINDDAGLEKEADEMGAKAMSGGALCAQCKTLASGGSMSNMSAPLQLLSFYHGGGKNFVESAMQNPHAAKASEGELGSKGMYYWKDDENAALVSSVIYNPGAEWAVMKIDIRREVHEANKNDTKTLIFHADSIVPIKTVDGVNSRVYGVHYRFLQNNLETKLGQAAPDLSIEGQLSPEYADMTGREFLDSFDLVVSPTKAKEYKYKNLKQVRANDTGLTNIIYGTAEDGSKNTFTKTWEGKITDGDHQSTITNMGLDQKDDVPDALLEMNGKKGTRVSKL